MPTQANEPRKPSQFVRGSLIVLALIAVLFFGCQWYSTSQTSPESPSLTLTAVATQPTPAGGSAFQVWFSDPWSIDAKKQVNGPEARLTEAIDQAQTTIDMAMYNFSLGKAADALIRAKGRGVRVRLVMESESIDNAATQKMQKAGIPIVGDRHEGLMHNKFTVIDGKEVWTGSLNMTSTSSYTDTNNLLRIRSAELAKIYTNEFEQMFTHDRFGPDRKSTNLTSRLSAGGMQMEVYFSPGDGAARHVADVLRAAKTSIHFLAYSYTLDDFGEAMISRARAGVQVMGIFDQSQYLNAGSEYDTLRSAGLKVRLDGWEGLQHSKVILIDGQIVITGSFNFTASADRTNDENLVIVYDPTLAGQYEAEFQKLYAKATP